MKYIRLTDEQVKVLGEEIYRGDVFTDRNIRNEEDLSRVFMTLALLDRESRDELLSIPIGMIYEHLSEKGPLGINGMPMFLSFHYLNEEDTKRVQKHAKKLYDAVNKVEVE